MKKSFLILKALIYHSKKKIKKIEKDKEEEKES